MVDTETTIKNRPSSYCLLCLYLCLQGPVLCFSPRGFVETMQLCSSGDGLEFAVDKCAFTLTPNASPRLRRHCSVLESVHFAFSKIHPKYPNKASHASVLACRSTQPAPCLPDFSPSSSSPGWEGAKACHSRLSRSLCEEPAFLQSSKP